MRRSRLGGERTVGNDRAGITIVIIAIDARRVLEKGDVGIIDRRLGKGGLTEIGHHRGGKDPIEIGLLGLGLPNQDGIAKETAVEVEFFVTCKKKYTNYKLF